jgi:LPXTG-motif cell wall anchor domain protein
VPKTADQFNPALYLGLFAIGATGAAVVAKKRKED